MRVQAAFLAVLLPAATAAWSAGKPESDSWAESTVEVRSVEALSKLDFVLPDGQLKSRLEAHRGIFRAYLRTFYDFPLGEIGYRFGIESRFFPWRTELAAHDDVQFERVLQSRRFLGRFRGATFEVGRDLGRRYVLDLILSGQFNTLIDLEEEVPEDDRGGTQQNQVSLVFSRNRLEDREGWRKGFRWSFRSDQAVRQFGGDFEYNKISFGLENSEKMFFFRTAFFLEAGSPVYRRAYPLFERFQRGGWDTFRGFGVNEIEGEKMVWAREEWTVPALSLSGRWLFVAPKGLDWVVSMDAGRAGDHDPDFFTADRYRVSAAGGVRFRWFFRDRVPVSLLFAWAKPLERRVGVFYFRYQIR